jgi:hypothetical protein
MPHGAWLPWLDAEFSWSEAQAKKFIAVAKAFSSPSIVTNSLTIDATALYTLSAPVAVLAGNDTVDRGLTRSEKAFHRGTQRQLAA